MGSLDPTSALAPLPPLKSFALTHILYDPAHPLSIPFTLLSLSPIFLFVSYFTLLVFDRRITVLALAGGSILNEILSLVLKRILKGERPYIGYGEVGDGYGMPSSHSQAAAFLVAWGAGYWLTTGRRSSVVYAHAVNDARAETIAQVRRGIYLFGLITWSLSVAYSRCGTNGNRPGGHRADQLRYHLHYHSIPQVLAGYLAGLVFGSFYFTITEYIPLYHPHSLLGKSRAAITRLWTGIGGVSGWEIASSAGGWGEGWITLGEGPVSAKLGKST